MNPHSNHRKVYLLCHSHTWENCVPEKFRSLLKVTQPVKDGNSKLVSIPQLIVFWSPLKYVRIVKETDRLDFKHLWIGYLPKIINEESNWPFEFKGGRWTDRRGCIVNNHLCYNCITVFLKIHNRIYINYLSSVHSLKLFNNPPFPFEDWENIIFLMSMVGL